jgi:hypothetical protein
MFVYGKHTPNPPNDNIISHPTACLPPATQASEQIDMTVETPLDVHDADGM